MQHKCQYLHQLVQGCNLDTVGTLHTNMIGSHHQSIICRCNWQFVYHVAFKLRLIKSQYTQTMQPKPISYSERNISPLNAFGTLTKSNKFFDKSFFRFKYNMDIREHLMINYWSKINCYNQYLIANLFDKQTIKKQNYCFCFLYHVKVCLFNRFIQKNNAIQLFHNVFNMSRFLYSITFHFKCKRH